MSTGNGQLNQVNEDETRTVFVRESRSCLGLTNDINQSSCLDSAYEFPLLLPRVYLPTGQDNLKVKCLQFIGTCHFMSLSVLRFLFGKMSVETYKNYIYKSSFTDFCPTSSFCAWAELDSYDINASKITKLDKVLTDIESIELFLDRSKNYIIRPLMKIIKDNKYSSKLLGLICLTLSFESDKELTSAGFNGFRLLSRSKLREMALKKQTIKYIRKSTNHQISVNQVCKTLLSYQDSIKMHADRFHSGPTQKTFFQRSSHTPSDENLKKLNLLTAYVFIFNNVDKFNEQNAATVVKIKETCIELFENLCYCAYKFKVFETAIARRENFEDNLEALEFASNVSWVV